MTPSRMSVSAIRKDADTDPIPIPKRRKGNLG